MPAAFKTPLERRVEKLEELLEQTRASMKLSPPATSVALPSRTPASTVITRIVSFVSRSPTPVNAREVQHNLNISYNQATHYLARAVRGETITRVRTGYYWKLGARIDALAPLAKLAPLKELTMTDRALAFMQKQTRSINAVELSKHLGCTRNFAYVLIDGLKQRGLVKRVSRGLYSKA